MIVTVTLNPAIDKTARIERLHPGRLNRLQDVSVDAGGKGVNASRVIAALGGESIATGFLGGATGREIQQTLQSKGISCDFVPISQATRTNLKLVEPDGTLTELNESGAAVTHEELRVLETKLLGLAGPDAVFVFAGSVPKGVPADIYARWIPLMAEKGAVTILDADGESFRAALQAKPHMIKPNRFELLQYFGLDDSSLSGLVGLGEKLLNTGIRQIAISMGSDGALFIDRETAFHAPALAVRPRSTVGAGDSMVAAMAYAAGQGLSWRDTAKLSMAASAGAVTTAGTRPADKGLIEQLLKQVVLRPV